MVIRTICGFHGHVIVVFSTRSETQTAFVVSNLFHFKASTPPDSFKFPTPMATGRTG